MPDITVIPEAVLREAFGGDSARATGFWRSPGSAYRRLRATTKQHDALADLIIELRHLFILSKPAYG